jgi:hypothetical protein
MTVERAVLVEYWPLVDVGLLDIVPGDVVVVNVHDRTLLEMPARQQLRETLERALPGVTLVVAEPGKLDFIVRRAMPEMRAEDLVQPARPRNME